MSVYETLRPLPTGSITIFRVVSVFDTAIRRLTAWQRARATRQQLVGLSDAQLADIGLTRGQIGDVSAALAQR